ncbi:transcription elongation factor A protein 3-like isoform X4 [Protopterus annectens]|uniref:transcription elongation factor A protein 3-like isoform X4 n=1 Tax=Protopterus annectens TaxID=7888 RepID=UPI001CFC2A1C|nr:transcription elongation factor A protein 3-like isoform X4 [Protopterus annectens]
MALEEDLIKIAKKLDKMILQQNMEGVLDLLKELQGYSMTLHLLKTTKIGLAVNAARKHCMDEKVVSAAKILIRNWKSLLESSTFPKALKDKESDKEMKKIHKSDTVSTLITSTESVSGLSQWQRSPEKKEEKVEKSPNSKTSTSSTIPKKHSKNPKKERRDFFSDLFQPSQETTTVTKHPTDKAERRNSSDNKTSAISSFNRPSSSSSSTSSFASSDPEMPPASKRERKDSMDSKSNHSLPVVKKPSMDSKKERKDSTDSKYDSKSPVSPSAKKPCTDIRKERKDSTDSKYDSKSPVSPSVKKPCIDIRKERKDSTDSKYDSKSLISKKPSLDTGKERKDSTDSIYDSKSPISKKPSMDIGKERKDSTDFKYDSKSPISKKSSLDIGKERKDSTDSRYDSRSPVSLSVKKPSLDIGKERKDSTDYRYDSRSPVSPPVKKPSLDIGKESWKGKTESPQSPTSPVSPSFSPSSDFRFSGFHTGDPIRDKCIEMLVNALKTNDDYKIYGSCCDQIASEIEEHIYQEMKCTDMKYKNRVRSRFSNLKDPKNPNLRKSVLCGGISAEKIARMTAEEMASDELKELRSTLTQEAIREHQMAKTGGTQTDLFQCSKCRKKNCTYNQVQTRSADEPMTTFMLCNECGFRWKFC